MRDFAAIDFETANYKPSSICSIGVVIVRDGVITERIHRLVCPAPNYYIARFTQEIHGIGYQDTCEEPEFPDVWSMVEKYIGFLPLVAHNKAFDENVLKKTFQYYEIRYPDYEFYCTYQAARRRIPRQAIDNYRLPTVCRYFDIEFSNHHDALADAEGCARIALKLL